jgi:hypothetical protein
MFMTKKLTISRRNARDLAALSADILSPGFGNTTPKFAYAVAKNYETQLAPEMKSITTAEKKDEGWTAYEAARLELAKAHAKKDHKGEPLVQGNSYVITDRIAFDEELRQLQTSEEYAEAYLAHEEMLDEEVTFQMHLIKLSQIPERVAGPVTRLMLNIIADDSEEEEK